MFLELEQNEPPGVSLRTRFLDSADAPVKVSAMPMMRVVPLSELLGPVTLDPLTVVQDSGFLDRLAEQANIPAPVMAELRTLYRSEEPTSELQSLMRYSYAVLCLKNKTYPPYRRSTLSDIN